MDAHLVWTLWRRILTDDRLVARVVPPIGGTRVTADAVMGEPELSAAERRIVDEYARTPIETDTNIGMYRTGLIRNALSALSLVPLSQQLLYMSGLDVDAVAADFVEADGYRDHGPNFWTCAAGFVGHLADRAAFTAPTHQDVLALDAAAIALARRLGADPDAWSLPDAGVSVGRGPARQTGKRYVASRAATIVASTHDLTAWIVNPQTFDPADPLAPTSHHWLIYFATAGAERGFAEVSARAARVFALLATPCTVAEVVAMSDQLPLPEATEIIGSLAALGAVQDDGGLLEGGADRRPMRSWAAPVRAPHHVS